MSDLDRFQKLNFELEDIFTDYFMAKQSNSADSMYYTNSEYETLNASYSNLTLNDISTTENFTQSEISLNDDKAINNQLKSEKVNTLLNEEPRIEVAKDVKLTENMSSEGTELENQASSLPERPKIPPGLLNIQDTKTVQNFSSNLQEHTPEVKNQNKSNPKQNIYENVSGFESLISFYNYLKLYIISQSYSYHNDVLQVLTLHFNDCDKILWALSITNDTTEKTLLSNAYVNKVQAIKNIIMFQKLQQSLSPVPQLVPELFTQNVLPMPQINQNFLAQLNSSVSHLSQGNTLLQPNLGNL